MRRHIRWPIMLVTILGLVAASIPASAEHGTRPHTPNIVARGHSPNPATFAVPDGQRKISSDIAFWGDVAFQGNYDGFRVIDISNPDNPVLLSRPECNGDQGDIAVWKHLLIRSWNSPAPAGRKCDGQDVPTGFEGVHLFDISNLANPKLVGSLVLECGSHTLTVAGKSRGKLIVYSNNSSSSRCIDGTQANDDPAGDFMDVIAVPLGNPAGATVANRVPLAGPADPTVRTGCHDAGVIRGEVNLVACASSDTTNVFDIGDNDHRGGSLVNPKLLFTITEPGVDGHVGRWHSATFTWDGEVVVLGWEPGGGAQAECEASDPDVKKSLFFYDAEDGEKLGQWVLPRPQGADENCTIHNYNIVPLEDEDEYIAVSGNYQAGTWVTDFSDPEEPETVAWSDPPSLGPGPFCDPDGPGPAPPTCQLGGDWSSYWYNDFIYESDITRGLNIFQVIDDAVDEALTLRRLNPQTQEFSLD